jgi:hypothetical protein
LILGFSHLSLWFRTIGADDLFLFIRFLHSQLLFAPSRLKFKLEMFSVSAPCRRLAESSSSQHFFSLFHTKQYGSQLILLLLLSLSLLSSLLFSVMNEMK